jgi:hypothetical protein
VRGIRGADAELVLDLGDVHARRAGLDDERLDAGAAGGAIERRPTTTKPSDFSAAMRPLVQKIFVPFSTQ